MTKAKWARWEWSKGKGRWHRLFTDGDLTKTACQTPRKSASHTAVETAMEPGKPVCPTCDLFEQLREKFVNQTDAIATTTVPVAVPDPVLVPAGVCICGAAACNTAEAIAIREAIAQREALVSAVRHAEFDALVASGQVVA